MPRKKSVPRATDRVNGRRRRRMLSAPFRQRGDKLFAGCALTKDEVDFGAAIDRYKREHGRPNPAWFEVLAIAKALGYRKVAAPTEMPTHPKIKRT